MNSQQMMEEIDRLARLCEANGVHRECKWEFEAERQRRIDAENKLSEAQAQIAMQAEKFQEIVDCPNENEGWEPWVTASEAISATFETVAAWRAKETEPYKREVEMLVEVAKLASKEPVGLLRSVALRAISDTQATALAYEREVKAKALWLAHENIDTIDDGDQPAYRHCQEMLAEMIEKLRAANKGEVK